MAHVLVVEDEPQLASLIATQLSATGHTASVAADGVDALRFLETSTADLIILDWMLPGLDGLEVCRRVRARSITPILMLTARAEEVDRVLGLEIGADDYLTKPFSMRELMARARSLLRRVDMMSGPDTSGPSDQSPTLTVGALAIDARGRTASVDGLPLDLTPKEFDLLHLLASQPGRAYSREVRLEVAYVAVETQKLRRRVHEELTWGSAP
jgi:DNA-binding response OmpR family regulator